MAFLDETGATIFADEVKTYVSNTAVAKETGKGLSTNDYTTEEKNKLDGLNDALLNKLGESTEGSLTYNGNEITSKADSELSTTSENPVQNKIITVKLNEKADSMVYDESNSKLKLMNGETVLSEVTVSGGGSSNGATIGVLTSESTLIGKEVVLSKDGTTVKTGRFNVSGICTFSGIEETGTYTVTSTDGTDSASNDVTITTDDILNKSILQVTIDFTLDGSTATPLNDVSIWLRTDSTGSSLNAGHTTLAEVIADTTTLSSLMADESAMNYLARSTGFAEEGCASETFMTYLGASTYVDSTVLNSDLWISKICNSIYMEKIFHDLIPAMTSDTCSVGSVTIANYVDSRSTKWALFNKNEVVSPNNLGTYYGGLTSTFDSIREFTFNQPVKIFCIKTVTHGHVETGSSSLNDAVFEVFAFEYSYEKVATVIQKQYPTQLCYNLFVTNLDNITKIKVVSHAVQYENNYFALDMSELYLYGR